MNNISFLLLFIFALNLYSQDKIELKCKERETLINNIIKANNITGYKGEVSVEILDRNFGYGGGQDTKENNITGKLYKAYFDLADKNAQKIIIYEDVELPKLEISLIKGKLKLLYDKKDITKNWKKYKNELEKYPYAFLYFLDHNGGKDIKYLFNSSVIYSSIRYIDLTSYFDMIKNEECVFYKLSENKDYSYYIDFGFKNPFNDEGITDEQYDNSCMWISDDFKIIYFDNGYEGVIYRWGENFPDKIEAGTVIETVEVIFLNKEGYLKK